jgi:hypothetical protein
MLPFSLLDLAEIFGFCAWPVIAFFAVLFGLIGLRKRGRQRRARRVT